MNEKLRALAIEIAQVRTGKPINVEFGTHLGEIYCLSDGGCCI